MDRQIVLKIAACLLGLTQPLMGKAADEGHMRGLRFETGSWYGIDGVDELLKRGTRAGIVPFAPEIHRAQVGRARITSKFAFQVVDVGLRLRVSPQIDEEGDSAQPRFERLRVEGECSGVGSEGAVDIARDLCDTPAFTIHAVRMR